MKIFINYRRADSADVTGRIYDRLVDHFGKPSIFKDVDNIPIGVNFKDYLDQQVKQCDIFLVVVGDKWHTIKDEHGNLRLHDASDYVRIEITSALNRKIPIVPVFVKGVSSIDRSALPQDLVELSYQNGIKVRPDPDFHSDMGKLIRALEDKLGVVVKKPEISKASSKPSPWGKRISYIVVGYLAGFFLTTILQSLFGFANEFVGIISIGLWIFIAALGFRE